MAEFVWTNPFSLIGMIFDFLLKRFLFVSRSFRIPHIEAPDLWQGKRVLVVGGTKGIGRGIASVLGANCGCVHIVGRDAVAGAEVVSSLKSSMPTGSFQYHQGDLFSATGCCALIDTIAASKPGAFDVLVLTVGVWPEVNPVKTVDGYNKVIQLDIIARYILMKKLAEAGLLTTNAVVMSVLGSGVRRFRPEDKMKDIITGAVMSKFVLPTLSTAVAAHDVMLHDIAESLPNMTFIGTWPGIIKTSLLDTTFGETLATIIYGLCALCNISISERQAGWNHSEILRYFVSTSEPSKQTARFFDDDLMEFDNRMIQTSEFRKWLSGFLAGCLKKCE